LFHDWSHHATGSAPGRPGVEQDRASAGVNHVPLKTGIGNYKWLRFRSKLSGLFQIERRTALTAARDVLSGKGRIDAILSSAIAAGYDRN
jgi:hypothetical protein